MRRSKMAPGPVVGAVGAVSRNVGRGIFAGLAGTAAMTAAQRVEMRLRGRPGSTAPGDLVAGVLGVEPKGEAERQRFSEIVHWTWGTGWGVLRGLLAASGLRGIPVALTHYTIVVSADFYLLTSGGVAPLPWRWTRQELLVELLHKGVLVTTTHVAYQLLDQ
jgi:hypothetical protein